MLKGRKGFLMRRLFRSADHVVALSEETRRDLIVAYDLNPKEVSSMPNAIDPAVFHPANDRGRLRSSLGLDVQEFLIGTVASLHPTKNHAATIRAMALLGQRGFPLPKCMVFGEGAERTNLESLIAANSLGDRLILAGRKSPVAPWIQSLDLFVLASHWEGQPLAILQALECGIPILASRIEGNIALLGKNHPGLFSPDEPSAYADLIKRACTESSFRSSILEFQNGLPRPSLSALSGELAALYTRITQRRLGFSQ
jgi:glycosyltransferase involved in cell wall biosynthesis